MSYKLIKKNELDIYLKVIKEVINIAKEKGIRKLYSTIYSFNIQSQKMFLSVGFSCIGEEQYILEL